MGIWWRWALISTDGAAPIWTVCLPLLIFPCTIKSRGSHLAPAHLGGPGKGAVKWLCVCVNCCRCNFTFSALTLLVGCQEERLTCKKLSD